MRPRPALTRLLAVLLLLQWGTAFAHCLRAGVAAEGLTVEICTVDGLHRVVLPAAPDDTDHIPATAAICPACQGPATVALTPPPVTLAPPVLLAQAADPPPAPPAAPLPTPPRSCQPRAPPTS